MPVNDGDALGVARGLEETEEVTLQVGGEGGSAPLVPGALPQVQTQPSTPATAGAELDQAQGGPAGGEEEVTLEDVEKVLEDAEDSDDLTEEEVENLKQLRDYLKAEARKELEEEFVPKLQSTYDRQIAKLTAQMQETGRLAQEREQELTEAIREAKLNGLTDAEKTQLKSQWDYEDRLREMDGRERELTAYHTELLREAYAQEYAEFGLTVDDLIEFDTPESMDEFVVAVQLEYYKQLAQMQASGQVPANDGSQSQAQPKPKAKAPAGAAAPSEVAGGGATPQVKSPNMGTGTQALYENLKDPDGWESITVRR